MSSDAGSVVTVEGRIDPDEVGTTLMHEHVFIDMAEAWFELPDSGYEREVAREPVSLDNMWYVRRNPLTHEDNMQITSVDDAIDELARYHRAGGDTVVDVTPKNVGGDPERVRGVARQTGLQLVHGTAYYVQSAHPDPVADLSVADLADEFTSDVREGIDDTDVRAGMVGEIGVSGHIHDDEEKMLRAAARAALRTGAPVNVHPPGRLKEAQRGRTYPSSRWGLEILDILESEGLPPERVVISHMDRILFEDLDYQFELADRGAYLEYDLWGTEFYFDSQDDGWPSDAWRAEAIAELIEGGCSSRLLLSHDICMKAQLTRYGGFGYGHILENAIPMLEERGVTPSEIDEMLVENPADVLTFVEPSE